MNCNVYVIQMFFQIALVYRNTQGVLLPNMFGMDNNCSQEKREVCIKIRQCPFFAHLLDTTPVPRSRTVIKLIQNNQCGFEGREPKVCCSLTANSVTLKNSKQSQHISKHFNLRLLPRNNCGRISHNFLITNGKKTAPLEFPWMALLAYHTAYGIKFKCGGTIINNRYVLTAAHCITSTLVGVRLGEHNVNTKPECDSSSGLCSSDDVQDYSVEQVIRHHNYKPKESPENDIALIRLNTPANFTYENVQPICLPLGEAATVDLDKQVAVVAGWGVTEGGYKSSELLKVSIPVIPLKDCKRINPNYASLTHKQFCAGGVLGRDSCNGDSGGPLKYVYYEDGIPRYVQYGIVAYGPKNCGTPGLPGVYTNVVYYMTWILNSLMP